MAVLCMFVGLFFFTQNLNVCSMTTFLKWHLKNCIFFISNKAIHFVAPVSWHISPDSFQHSCVLKFNYQMLTGSTLILTIERSLLLFFNFSSCLSVTHWEILSLPYHKTLSPQGKNSTFSSCSVYQCFHSILQLVLWVLTNLLLLLTSCRFCDRFLFLLNCHQTSEQWMCSSGKHFMQKFKAAWGSCVSHLRFLLCFSTSAFNLLYFSVR